MRLYTSHTDAAITWTDLQAPTQIHRLLPAHTNTRRYRPRIEKHIILSKELHPVETYFYHFGAGFRVKCDFRAGSRAIFHSGAGFRVKCHFEAGFRVKCHFWERFRVIYHFGAELRGTTARQNPEPYGRPSSSRTCYSSCYSSRTYYFPGDATPRWHEAVGCHALDSFSFVPATRLARGCDSPGTSFDT